MIPKAFDQLSDADILILVDSRASERRTLEFKRDLPGNSEKDVREFLADVTSFANANGGDIIYGISADKEGRAEATAPLADLNGDQALLRLAQIVRSSTEPRLNPLMEVIEGSSGSFVVIRVQASMTAPHRITHGNSNRFFSRDSRGKYEMNTDDLRAAFTASESVVDRLKALHSAAEGRAASDLIPFDFPDTPLAVLTVAPLRHGGARTSITPANAIELFPPEERGSLSHQVTLEGILAFRARERSITSQLPPTLRSYALLHRSGFAEFAWVIGEGPDEPRVWIQNLERDIDRSISDAVRVLRSHGVEGPWVAFLTLQRVAGARLIFPWHGGQFPSEPTRRSRLAIPEVIFDSPTEADKLQLLELVWAGFHTERPAKQIGL